MVNKKRTNVKFNLTENEWMQRCQDGQLEILRLSEILCDLRNELEGVKETLENERSQHCLTQKRLSDALNCISSLKCEMGKKDVCMAKLQDALRNTGLKVVQHVNRIDQLESCTNQWQQETWELRTMLTKALKERSDCEDELCKKTEETKKLHFELCKLKTDNDNLLKEVFKERSDCEVELCKKTEETKKLHFELSKLRNEKDNLMKEVVNKRNSFDEANGECTRLQDDVNHLEKIISNLQCQNVMERQMFEQELSKRKEGINKLEKELQNLKMCQRQMVQNKKESMMQLKERAEEEITKRRQENLVLKSELNKIFRMKCNLETQVKDMIDTINRLEKAIMEKDELLKNIEGKITQLEMALKCQVEKNSMLGCKLNQVNRNNNIRRVCSKCGIRTISRIIIKTKSKPKMNFHK